MGTTLNRIAYQRMIDENIIELEKYMPEHSLEKKHTIEVLKWSVRQIYGDVNTCACLSRKAVPSGDHFKCKYCGKTIPD